MDVTLGDIEKDSQKHGRQGAWFIMAKKNLKILLHHCNSIVKKLPVSTNCFYGELGKLLQFLVKHVYDNLNSDRLTKLDSGTKNK